MHCGMEAGILEVTDNLLGCLAPLKSDGDAAGAGADALHVVLGDRRANHMSYTGDLLDVELTELRGKARHIDVDDIARVRVVLNSLVGVVRVCTEGVRAEELLLLLHVGLGRLGDLRVLLLGVLIDVHFCLVMVEAVLVEVGSQLVLRDSLAGVGLVLGVAPARLIREPVHRGGDDTSVGFPGRSAAWWPIRPMAPVIKIYLLFVHRFHVGVVRLG